jgi:hypothetical protein
MKFSCAKKGQQISAWSALCFLKYASKNSVNLQLRKILDTVVYVKMSLCFHEDTRQIAFFSNYFFLIMSNYGHNPCYRLFFTLKFYLFLTIKKLNVLLLMRLNLLSPI